METIKIYSSFILLPFFFSLLQVDAFLLTIVSAYIRPCDTNNFTKRLTRMYHHSATESQYCLHGAKTSWTPIIAEVSYKFGFVYLFICLQYKISSSSIFFLIFYHEVRPHKVIKWRILVFEKTFMGSEGSKLPQKRFWGFSKSLIHSDIYVFCFTMKVSMVFWPFGKSLVYGPKTSKPIRMQDFLN